MIQPDQALNAMPGPAGGLASETQVTTSHRPVRHSPRAAVGPRNAHPSKPRQDEANRCAEAGDVQISQVLHNRRLVEITAEFSFIYHVRNAGLRRGRR